VIEPSRWEDVIGAIAREYTFANGVLTLQAFPSGTVLLATGAGVSPEWMRKFADYGPAAFETWGGAERISRIPLDEPVVQSHQTPRASWVGNRFHEDFAVPHGLFDTVAIKCAGDSTMVGSLTFGRAIAAGEIGEAELVPLRLIAPHVRRALVIGKLLELNSLVAATFESAMDALPTAVILVDAAMRCVHRNRAAAAIAESGGPLLLKSGRVVACTSTAKVALEAAVVAAAGDEAALGRRGLGVPVRDGNGDPFVIHVLPLRRGEIRPGLTPSAVAALFVTQATAPPQFPADALALLYDLTPAETRVLLHVAAGTTIAEIAGELGVRPATVRTHLHKVFDKTGCTRQAELVGLVASLSLPD
jgi:DNA-binding CsgD family transcriptional regulator